MTEHIDEQWRTISRNSNYLVSNMGRVSNERTGRILKGCSSAHGTFTIVNLYNKGQRETHYIHHLFAEAFLAKPPSDSGIITVNYPLAFDLATRDGFREYARLNNV